VKRRGLLAAGAAVGLSACTLAPDADHDGPEAPRLLARPVAPGVTWVMSSGGPRGFVHIGVIKALEDLGLRPAMLVGASAGALVAVLHAGGLSARRIEALALDLEPRVLGRLALNAPGGERLWGGALAQYVRDLLPDPRLDRLPLPAVCVCAMQGAGVVAFNAGDAGTAVQAATAIEGVFAPVRIGTRRYLDADLLQPLPVRVARQLGARRVLAVDASAHEHLAPPGAEGYRGGDLRKRALTQPDAALADLLLHPEFDYYVSLSREFRLRTIQAGYDATMAQAAALRTLHSG
jgi:NTE family protein